jgi:hypothetical protein
MRTKLRSRLAGWLVIALMSPALFQQSFSQDRKAAPPPPKLKVGDMAPNFKLQYFDGKDLKDVSLSDYRGKRNVALAFYIFAFTGG